MWWSFLLGRDTKTGFLVFYCVESEKRSFYAVKYRDPSPRYQGLFCVGSESVLNMMEDIKSFVQKVSVFLYFIGGDGFNRLFTGVAVYMEDRIIFYFNQVERLVVACFGAI